MTKSQHAREYDFAGRADGRGDVMWTDVQLCTVPTIELAERIAKALNAHDALVEALETLLAWADAPGVAVQPGCLGDQARAALKLAKEG